MNRRELMLGGIGLAGAWSPSFGASAAKPCPPSPIQVGGSQSDSGPCPQNPTESLPAWAQGAVGEWREIPGSALSLAMSGTPVGGSFQGIYADSGGAFDPVNSHYYVIGGGHSDYAGNEVYRIKLNQENPTFERLSAPTPTNMLQPTFSSEGPGYPVYKDGRPSSNHTWGGTVQFVPSLGAEGQLVTMGHSSAWGNGNGRYPHMHAWDVATREWTWLNPDPINSPFMFDPNLPPFTTSLGHTPENTVQDKRGDIWVNWQTSGSIYRIAKWSPVTKSWSSGISVNRNVNQAMVYDPVRDRVIDFQRTTSEVGIWFNALNPGTPNRFQLGGDLSGTPVAGQDGSCWYEPTLDRYVLLPVAVVEFYWLIHPETFVVTKVITTGTKPPVPVQNGIKDWNTRFCFVPALKGCVLFHFYSLNAHFVRTS